MTDDKLGNYTVQKPSFLRQLAMDSFAALPDGHPMTALMELDVTDPLERIEALRAEGVRVSLFAHVVRSIGVALSEHPKINVVMHGRKFLYFEDVDINIPVEVKTADGHFPLQLVVRRAQDKTASEVYAVIADAKAQHAATGSTGAEDRWARRLMGFARFIPRFLRIALIRLVIRNGKMVKQRSGTTLVTSVGKFASIPGFVTTFGPGPRGATFALGSVVDKPVVRDGEVVVRKILSFTAIFNHDVVDGGPAARFGTRLRELVESAEGLT